MNKSDLTSAQMTYLLTLAQSMQESAKDYAEIACDLPCDVLLLNYQADGVWLARMNTEVVDMGQAERLVLIAPANPCHMVCEGVADPVGEAIEEDAALRFKMGRNADGGVTLSRQPERKTLDELEAENPEGFRNPGEFEPVVSKVQQVGQYVALKMAYEVIRQTGHAVAVSVEIVPFGDNALHYIITSPKGEKVKLLCSSTSFERLAQMAALLAKGE